MCYFIILVQMLVRNVFVLSATFSFIKLGYFKAPKVVKPIKTAIVAAIFSQEHSEANVSIYASALGFISGIGFIIGCNSTWVSGFGFFLGFVALFHTCEYISTSTFKKDASLKCNPRLILAFLLNHSQAYHFAILAGAFEYVIELWLFPSIKKMGIVNYFAVIVVILAQCLRTLAMCTCASNFSHLIQYRKEQDHVLVTHGVYAIFRHPSYTGFFYWGVALQIMLFNPVCAVAYAYALHSFFSTRIPEEEETLVGFFGQDYINYSKTSSIFIPFIN